jgi:ATP-binding cassette subfamily B protein
VRHSVPFVRSRALLRVLPYVRPYRRRMAFIAGSAVVGLVAGAIVPLVTKNVIDGPLADGDRSAIWPLAGLVVVLGAFETGLASLRRRQLGFVAMGIETDLRNDLYAHLQRMDVGFHDQWQSGQLLSRATSDISAIRRFTGFGIVFLLINVVTFSVVVAMMARLHLPLAVLVGLTAVPLTLLLKRFEAQYQDVSRRIQEQQGDVATQVEEAATGIRTIRAFGRSRLMAGHFQILSQALHDSSMERVRLLGKFEWVLGVVPNVTLGLILLIGALAVGTGSLTLGGLVAFISYLLMLIWPIEAMGWILAMAEEAETASARIFEIFDTEPVIADRPSARVIDRVDGRLRFESVSFAYPGKGPEVLRGIDLDIERGETVALVGMTGSGKTTLASLVPRLYDVTSGRITVDGVDVRDMTLSSLRHAVGFAFEEPTLFSASVRENLLLGFAQATERDIADALAIAQAEFVHDLPWGLETRIGEQGMSLSGGQRQRLALARAIIAKPPVLVLDDPLSALDMHTEALVEEALSRVLAGVTALIVVHRPSTVALADRAALLHDGRIVAVGTHHELMESDDRYRSILSQEAEGVSA